MEVDTAMTCSCASVQLHVSSPLRGSTCLPPSSSQEPAGVALPKAFATLALLPRLALGLSALRAAVALQRQVFSVGAYPGDATRDTGMAACEELGKSSARSRYIWHY